MDKNQSFLQLVEEIKHHHCSLRDGCIQSVPGDGDINSPVMFIGEAPGKSEDEQGIPFVGAAGKLLAEALEQIGWNRDQVYITNIVKCRPPGNRDPLPEEVEEHKQFLSREIKIIKPKVIVLLGRHALHWFIPELQISKVRGQAKRMDGQVYFPIYHPAAALYNGSLRETFFNDINKIPALVKQIQDHQTTI
ncbi:MAG: uracil-DNA glycosylase [Patescibacteria group bacterium]